MHQKSGCNNFVKLYNAFATIVNVFLRYSTAIADENKK